MPAHAKCLLAQLAHFGVSNGDVFGSNPSSPNNQSIKNKKLKGNVRDILAH